jgi:hypothetical protein
MMRIDHTVDSSPIEKPDRIVVAVRSASDSAISCTGGLRVGEVLRQHLDHAREDEPEQDGDRRAPRVM